MTMEQRVSSAVFPLHGFVAAMPTTQITDSAGAWCHTLLVRVQGAAWGAVDSVAVACEGIPVLITAETYHDLMETMRPGMRVYVTVSVRHVHDVLIDTTGQRLRIPTLQAHTLECVEQLH